MARCIVCSGIINKPGGPIGTCTEHDCDGLVVNGYKYCRQCSQELNRCECCGKKLEQKEN